MKHLPLNRTLVPVIGSEIPITNITKVYEEIRRVSPCGDEIWNSDLFYEGKTYKLVEETNFLDYYLGEDGINVILRQTDSGNGDVKYFKMIVDQPDDDSEEEEEEENIDLEDYEVETNEFEFPPESPIEIVNLSDEEWDDCLEEEDPEEEGEDPEETMDDLESLEDEFFGLSLSDSESDEESNDFEAEEEAENEEEDSSIDDQINQLFQLYFGLNGLNDDEDPEFYDLSDPEFDDC